MVFRTTAFLIVLAGTVLSALPLRAADIPKDPNEALTLGRSEKVLAVTLLNKARRGGPDEAKHAREAMKHLETAQEAFAAYLDAVGEDEKVEEEMSEVQSLIYWCRKMTPLRDDEEDSAPEPEEPPEEDDGGSDPAPPARNPLEAPRPGDPVPKPGPPKSRDELAQEYYEDAERFAAQFPDLKLQIVAAFFRVADAFKDTAWGAKALERALAVSAEWKKEVEGVKAPDPATPEPKTPEPVTDPTMLRLRLRHTDPKLRAEAVAALVTSVGKDAVPDLHELFLGEKDAAVRAEVVKQLAALKDKRTIKALKRWWDERDALVAGDVIRLVGALDDEKYVKYAAFAVVRNTKRLMAPSKQRVLDTDFDALDTFISQVRSEYGSGLRGLLKETLSKMNREKGGKGLVNLFKTPSGAVPEAILCLGAMGDVKNGKNVVIYIASYKAGVYCTQAMASMKMMGDDAIPVLISSLAQPQLKMWCAALLRNITGQPFSGGNQDKWWAWWKANRRR